MAEVQILVEGPVAVQGGGDLGHLGDQLAASGAAKSRGSSAAGQRRDRLVQRLAAGQLGDHQEALQRPQGPIRSPAATTSGTAIPSARTRSRWAHSAEPGECRPAGWTRAASREVPGEPVVPLQVDGSGRPPPCGTRRGPSNGPCLAWNRSRLSSAMTVASRSAGSARGNGRRARSSGCPRTRRSQKRDRGSWVQPFPRVGTMRTGRPGRRHGSPLPRSGNAATGVGRVGQDGAQGRGPSARRRELVGPDDDVGSRESVSAWRTCQ